MQNDAPIFGVERLPFELVLDIFDHAACASQACLVTLCQVNKALQARYEPMLYRHVDVLSPRGYSSLHCALKAKPHLQKEIRHLALGPFVYAPDAGDAGSHEHVSYTNPGWWSGFQRWTSGNTPQSELDSGFDFASFPRLRRLFIQVDAVPWWTYKHLTATIEEITVHYRNYHLSTGHFITELVKDQDRVIQESAEANGTGASSVATKSIEMLRASAAERLPLRRLHVHGFAGLSDIIHLRGLKEVVFTAMDPQHAYLPSPQHGTGKGVPRASPITPAAVPPVPIIPPSLLSVLASSSHLERLTIQAQAQLLKRMINESAVQPPTHGKPAIHLRATVTLPQVVSCHKQFLKAVLQGSNGASSGIVGGYNEAFTEEGALPFQTAAVETDWLDRTAMLRYISRAEALGFAVEGVHEMTKFNSPSVVARCHKEARRQAEDLAASEPERQASWTPSPYALNDEEERFWSSQPIRDGAYCGHIGLPWAGLENDIRGMTHRDGLRIARLRYFFTQHEREKVSNIGAKWA